MHWFCDPTDFCALNGENNVSSKPYHHVSVALFSFLSPEMMITTTIDPNGSYTQDITRRS